MDTFDFGEAIHRLKDGRRVARSGWNGKGMFIIRVPGTQQAMLRDDSPYFSALRNLPDFDGTCEILPHIDMWTTNSEGRRAFLPGWLASQTDMLATDWSEI